MDSPVSPVQSLVPPRSQPADEFDKQDSGKQQQDFQNSRKSCDGDVSSVLTQRRSLGDFERPCKSRPCSSGDSNQTPCLRSIKLLCLMGALALVMLLTCLSLIDGPKEWYSYLGQLPAKMYGSVIPVGANLWLFQWQYQERPDPRPLWNPDMMGKNASWLHGSATGLKLALQAETSKRAAIVGNGPISDEQRTQVSKADIIVRFNAMNNRKRDERTDLWIVRNNHMMPYLYWGFEQLSDEEVYTFLENTKAVLFLSDFMHLTRGINRTHEASITGFLQTWYGSARDEQLHQVDISGYWKLYAELFSKTGISQLNSTDAMPSSGLLGVLAVLALVKGGTNVDLYGFNWSDRAYIQHMMSNEELIIQALKQDYPRLRIHPTACNGLYHCNQICDTAQFRMAVDEENCNREIERARNGSQARFIDQHTTQHLEWHSQLMDELKLTAKKNGIVKPSKTELENLARDWADGRSRSSVQLGELASAQAPQIFHQKVSMAKLVASERRRIISSVASPAESHPRSTVGVAPLKPGEDQGGGAHLELQQAQSKPANAAFASRMLPGRLARLRRPQPNL